MVITKQNKMKYIDLVDNKCNFTVKYTIMCVKYYNVKKYVKMYITCMYINNTVLLKENTISLKMKVKGHSHGSLHEA